MRIIELQKHYPTQKHCCDLLDEIVWNYTPSCPHCGSSSLIDIQQGHYNSKDGFKCGDCVTHYTVTTNTIFHKTQTPLVKWFTLIDIIKTSNRMPSSRRLAYLIGVTAPTALRLRKMVLADLESDDSLCERIYQHNRQIESDW